jgi:hypothetical protein
MQDKHFVDIFESEDSSMQLINKLYRERNRLNNLLYQQYPEFKEICRIVMVANNSLIIHASGNKASHRLKLKQEELHHFLIKHVTFKEILIKNVVKL